MQTTNQAREKGGNSTINNKVSVDNTNITQTRKFNKYPFITTSDLSEILMNLNL